MNYIVRMKTGAGKTESVWSDLGDARNQTARLLKLLRRFKDGRRVACMCKRVTPLCYFELGRFRDGVGIEVLREHADGRRENFREDREGGESNYDLAVKYRRGWEKEVNQ